MAAVGRARRLSQKLGLVPTTPPRGHGPTHTSALARTLSGYTETVGRRFLFFHHTGMKATLDHEEGRPVISRRFKPVAEVVLARMEAEIAAGTAKPSTRDYVSAIRLYLIR